MMWQSIARRLALVVIFGWSWAALAVERLPYGGEIAHWRRRSVSQKFEPAVPGALQLLHTELTLSIVPATAQLSMQTTLVLHTQTGTLSTLVLVYGGPPVGSVSDSLGSQIDVEQFSEGYIRLRWQKPIPADSEVSLTIEAAGQQSCDISTALIDTVCEISPDFAWFLGAPYMPRLTGPDQYGTQRTTVVVPAGFRAVASGRRVATRHETTSSRYIFESFDETTSQGLAVGKFVTLTGNVGKTAIEVNLLPRHADRLGHVLMQLKAMLPHLESWLGPLFTETLVVGPFGDGFRGAFAPQAAIFVSTFLLDRWDDTRMAQLLAHELAHQWFGHLVSVRSIQDVWLQEGMAEFIASHYVTTVIGRPLVFRENALIYLGRVNAADDVPLAPLSYPGDARYFALAYAKASVVLNSLRQRLGDEAFFAGLRSLLTTHRFAYFDTAALQSILVAAHGDSVTEFFAQHVYRAGVPQLALTSSVIGEIANPTGLQLTLSQPASDPYRLSIPVTLRQLETWVLDLTLDGEVSRPIDHPLQGPLRSVEVAIEDPLLVRWQSQGNGDINRDGIVDGRDLLQLALAFGTKPLVRDEKLERTVGNLQWNPFEDLDDSGQIDAADLDALLLTFGTSGSQP